MSHFSIATRYLRDGNYDKAHELVMMVTTLALNNRLDHDMAYKAWIFRWLALIARKRPSDEAAGYCVQIYSEVSRAHLLMQEILGLRSIEAVEHWIMSFVRDIEMSVFPELGLALHTLGFYGLSAEVLEAVNPEEMDDPVVLYTLGDALHLSGQIGRAITIFEERMYPVIEFDNEAVYALLGIAIYSAAQMYEKALFVADKMLIIHTLSDEAKHHLRFERAQICIRLHDNEAANASLDALKVPRDHPEFFEVSLLRARASPPSKAIGIYESLLHTLGVQSGAMSSTTASGSSTGSNGSATSASAGSAATASSRDVNGLEFKIRLAKLRVQLKVATSANELDPLLKACADLEWASHPKVSFIWACAAVKRAWFCVPERSNLRHLPLPSSYIPISRPPASRHMIDQVQALNASGSSLFSSNGSKSGGSKFANTKPLQKPIETHSSTIMHQTLNTMTHQDASSSNISAATATAIPSSTNPASAMPPASPSLNRSRGRRNSIGAPAQSELSRFLNLARTHFQNARDRVVDPSTLVSQYHKVLALHLHAPTEEYALELKEEAQKFLDRCITCDGTYVPKVAVLLASVLRKDGHITEALDLLSQTQNMPQVHIERLLCEVAQSRATNLGERHGDQIIANEHMSQRILQQVSSKADEATSSSSHPFPSSSTVGASTSSSSSSHSHNARGQSHHQLVVNRVIDELSQIKGRFWESAQFHAGRLYEDELGQLEQADARYRHVTQKNPNHMQSRYRLAFLRCRRVHPESAAACSAILKHYPNDLMVLEWRAGAYVVRGKYVEAIQDYDRIISRDPSLERVRRSREVAASLLTATGYYSTMVSESAQNYGQAIKSLFNQYWYGGKE